MLTEVVTHDEEPRAFGLLHALDVGGGLLAALAVVVMVSSQVSFRTIFLVSILPLVLSTACLARVAAGARVPAEKSATAEAEEDPAVTGQNTRLYRGVIVAAALYGFSSYSLGFPILTVAQGTTAMPPACSPMPSSSAFPR